MSPDSLVPLRSSGRLLDARLSVLITDLRRQDLRCQVLTVSLQGEQDLRLEICSDASPASVELLWRSPGLPDLAQWHAVRVLGDERAVWRGPEWNCPRPQLVGFVCDLLQLDDTQLPERYLLLG